MHILFRLGLSSLVFAGAILACSSSTTTSAPPATGGDGGATDPDSGSPEPDDSSTTPEAAAPFKLTSTALAEGASFAADNTCTGTNVSPPFAWGPGPAGAMSYAIVLTDTTNGLIHAILYDIPASNTALAADYPAAYAPAKPAGAHETKNYKGQFGYAGPCPPNEHVYEFALYAVDVATLPGLGMASTTTVTEAAIKMHSLGSTKLTGKYKQP